MKKRGNSVRVYRYIACSAAAIICALTLSACSGEQIGAVWDDVEDGISSLQSAVSDSSDAVSTAETSASGVADQSTEGSNQSAGTSASADGASSSAADGGTDGSVKESSDSASSAASMFISVGQYPTPEMVAARIAIGLTDDNIDTIQSGSRGYYYYDALNTDDKVVYAEIYRILTSQAENIYISTVDMDKIDMIQQCVLNDHPEIFYVSGYTCSRYVSSNEEVKAITFGGKYIYSPEEIASRQGQIETTVAQILDGAPQTDDGYTLVRYFYDYIVLNTEYDLHSEDNQNICSVFLNRRSVCQGYAKAMQYLLQSKGITAEMVSGTVAANGTTSSHAWNLVKLDGDWYYVDVTWGDSSFLGGTPGGTEIVNYAYLLVTTDDLMATHTLGERVSLPRCTATRDNYFIRENAYFYEMDEALLGELFRRGYESGMTAITFKCADTQLYQTMNTYLFSNDGGHIFELLSTDRESVTYLGQDTTLTYIIWL